MPGPECQLMQLLMVWDKGSQMHAAWHVMLLLFPSA